MSEAKWLTQIKKGLLELCLLNILKAEPLYGYKLIKKLKEASGLVITEGTIYPLLSRLKKEGLVRSYLDESPSGPARRNYILTEEGKNRLSEMNKIWIDMTKDVKKFIRKSERVS